jgi:hypothetical protein
MSASNDWPVISRLVGIVGCSGGLRRGETVSGSIGNCTSPLARFEKLVVKAVSIFIGVVNREGHIDDPSSPTLASADGVAAYH